MNLSIAKIKKQELYKLMQQDALKEGWLYSPYDVDFYFNNPRNQIFAVNVDDELAGCVLLHESLSLVQEKPLRSLGFFLVVDKYRGQKIIGPHLHQTLASRLGLDTFVCFHSVPRAVEFYGRLGFKKTSLVDLFYALKADQFNKDMFELPKQLLANGTIKKIENNNLNQIEAYNKNLFLGVSGIGFCEFIHHWMRRADAIVIAYYDKDVVQGYGIATICQKINHDNNDKLCYRISPIYAESAIFAGAILKGLIYYAFQANGQRMELNSLAAADSEFGQILKETGFVESGKNYIVCNQVGVISENVPILSRIFSSLPLEYPHEVTAGLI